MTGVRIHFLRQSCPVGLWHALLQAKDFFSGAIYVVMLRDDLMPDEVPFSYKLINV